MAKCLRCPKVADPSKHTHLANNAKRFSKFLHSAEVPIITIAVLSDGNVELDLDGSSNR